MPTSFLLLAVLTFFNSLTASSQINITVEKEKAVQKLQTNSSDTTGFHITKGGMPYQLFSNGKGATLQPGDIIKYELIMKVNDSILRSTYGKEPFYLSVPQTDYPYDISEVLPLLRKGDSVYAFQLMDSFIKKTEMVPPGFKKGDTVYTSLKIVDVFKTNEAADQDRAQRREALFHADQEQQAQLKKDIAALNAYLTENKIQGERTVNGAVVQKTAAGKGEKVTLGKYVLVSYRGKTLSGKIFDTNMDNSFKHPEPLGFYTGKGGMMRGFEEAVLMLSKGDRAIVYIPAALAYGENPPAGSRIGKNENLVFEVYVIDVMDKAPEK